MPWHLATGDFDTMAADHTVFRATAADLESARAAMLDLHERKILDDDSLRAFLNDDACYLILAIADDLAVGSLIGYRLRNPHSPMPQFLIYEIDVLAKEQNVGIGKRLIRVFAESARTVDAFEIWVVTNRSNHPAVAMYSAMGFVPVNDDDQMLELRLVPELPIH